MEVSEAKVDATAQAEQGTNGLRTRYDQSQAIDYLLEIATGWEDKRRAFTLFKALCLLTKDGTNSSGGFTSMDLALKVRELGEAGWGRKSKDEEPEYVSTLVSKHWKVLEKAWEERRLGVQERFEQAEISYVPELVKREGGGQGNPSRYLLLLRNQPTAERENATEDSDRTDLAEGEVCYFTDEIAANRFTGWVSRGGYALMGWRKVLFLLFLMAVLLAVIGFVGVSWLGIATSTHNGRTLQLLTVAISSVGLTWYLMRWFIALANNRVALAPMTLQPWASGHDDRLLELRWSEALNANAIVLTRYTAKCPKCGGIISIASGRIEFWGRLVGRCRKAPNEHVYSFDPVLRVGKSLRG